jgi:hypothetical protein
LEPTKPRPKALDAKVVYDGGVLTESHLFALERAKADKRRIANSTANIPDIVWRRLRSWFAEGE